MDGPEPLVSMEVKGVELNDLLRAIGREAGLDVLVGEGVSGKVTASLRDVPLREALDSILKNRGLSWWGLESGLMEVGPARGDEKEEMELTVGKFRLNYLKASDSMVSAVEKLLSPRGRVSRLRETNSLVVKDIPVSVRRVEDFLLDVDRRPGQILIETRIVEVNSGYMKELGINWQASYGYKSNDVLGGLGSVESSAGLNLPPSLEEGLSLGFGLVSDKLTLDIRLSALEDRGKAKVVSTPSVMVLDNHTAVISDGTELLVPSMDATTVIKTGDSHGDLPYRSEIFRAVLELAVTPRVIDSGRLSLFINTKREEFNFEREVQGYPPKITKSLRTELIVRDGDTVAIGGIKTETERDNQSGVPLLSRIPLLGWLFKKETRSEDRAELIIFLTPKIME
jgi:type IV pilus assembly protein PilQ